MVDTSPEGCATGECLPGENPGTDTDSLSYPGRGPFPSTSTSTRPSSSPTASTTASAPPAPEPSSFEDDDEPEPESVAPPASFRPATPGTIGAERWRVAVDAVRQTSPRHGKSLSYGRLLGAKDGTVTLGFTADAAFHRTTVMGTGLKLIEETLSQKLGTTIKLVATDVTQSDGSAPSIAEEETQQRVAHERSVDARVRSHPAVAQALKILGGELEHIFIQERERPTVVEPDLPDESA